MQDDALTSFLKDIETWLYSTPLSSFLTDHGRLWPWIESLHYIGLIMLFSSVIIFDLRVLGLMKSLSIPTLHKLIPIGMAGFALNVTTGSLFLTNSADQYIRNSAFQLKFLCLMIAGANVVAFYLFAWPQLKKMGDTPQALSWRIKIFTLISLAAWTGVIIGGRLITFYRPS